MPTALAMDDAVLFGEFMLPAMPAALALALVAALGYFVGRRSRQQSTDGGQTRRHLERALGDARYLEQLVDDVLQATRRALSECSRHSAFQPGKQEPKPPRPNGVAKNRREPTLATSMDTRDR